MNMIHVISSKSQEAHVNSASLQAPERIVALESLLDGGKSHEVLHELIALRHSVGLAEGQVFCNPPHLTQQKIVNILTNSKIHKMSKTSPLPEIYGGGGGDQVDRRRVV